MHGRAKHGPTIVALGLLRSTRDSRLVHGADVLHHVLHAEHPEWDRMADVDRELGLTTRRRVLVEPADGGVPCTFSHLAGPRPLTVVRVDNAFRLVAG
jgi:hypothetical protein